MEFSSDSHRENSWSPDPAEAYLSDSRLPSSYMGIEIIDNVVPLDAQFGVYPKKTAPDRLIAPLFGAVPPDQADLDEYGSADAVPPMKTYVILDAAKIANLADMLENSGIAFRCLFKGKAAEINQNHAPYLIELEIGDKLSRSLFTDIREMPEELVTAHLWRRQSGIFLRSRKPLADIWRHFRKFTKFPTRDSDAWYFFRFYDPRVFRTFVTEFDEALFRKFAMPALCFYVPGSDGNSMLKVFVKDRATAPMPQRGQDH